MTKMTQEDRETQAKIDEIARKIVEQNVLAEISSAIVFYQEHAQDEFANALYEATDRDATQEEKEVALQNALSLSEIKDALDDIEIEYDPEAKINVLFRLLMANADLDALLNDYGVDVEPFDTEIYQYWLVENCIAREMQEQGEIILDLPIFNQLIWCRQACGQAIYADEVFQSLAKDRLEKYGA